MTTNTALTALTALTQSGNANMQAVDTEAALDRLEPDPALQDSQQVPDSSDDGKAKFGTPEAVGTAIAASFLFGPAAGVALGLAQGFLKREADQKVLDVIARDNARKSGNLETFEGVTESYMNEIKSLRSIETTPEDAQLIDGFEIRLDAANEFLMNADEGMQGEGITQLEKLRDDMTSFTVDQETQRIERKAADDLLQRTMGERAYTEHKSLHGTYMTRTDPLVNQQLWINEARQGLSDGDGMGLFASKIKMIRLQNPESVDLPESMIAQMESINGTADSIQARLEQEAGTGGGWTDRTRRMALEYLDSAESFVHSAYDNVNADTLDQLQLSPVTPNFWSSYTRDNAMQSIRPKNFIERNLDSDVPEGEQASGPRRVYDATTNWYTSSRDAALTEVFDVIDIARAAGTDVTEAGQQAIEGIGEFAGEFGEGVTERARSRGRRMLERRRATN